MKWEVKGCSRAERIHKNERVLACVSVHVRAGPTERTKSNIPMMA